MVLVWSEEEESKKPGGCSRAEFDKKILKLHELCEMEISQFTPTIPVEPVCFQSIYEDRHNDKGKIVISGEDGINNDNGKRVVSEEEDYIRRVICGEDRDSNCKGEKVISQEDRNNKGKKISTQQLKGNVISPKRKRNNKGKKISSQEDKENNSLKVYERKKKKRGKEEEQRREGERPKSRRMKKGGKRTQLKWSDNEVSAFIRAVIQCGEGHWAEILKRFPDELIERTPVDLKNKWRRLKTTQIDLLMRLAPQRY